MVGRRFQRLFRQLLIEVWRVTKPEAIAAGAFATALYIYRYFWGDRLFDVYSVVVPAVWVGSTFGCYFAVKAARQIHRTDVFDWETNPPLIVGAIKPPRPSAVRLISPAGSFVLLFCAICFLSVTLIPDRSTKESSLERPRLQPILVIDSLGDRDNTNFHIRIVNGPIAIRELQVAYSTGKDFTFDTVPLDRRDLASGERMMIPGQLFTDLATSRRLSAVFAFSSTVNGREASYTTRYRFALPRGDIAPGREFEPISKRDENGNTLEAESKRVEEGVRNLLGRLFQQEDRKRKRAALSGHPGTVENIEGQIRSWSERMGYGIQSMGPTDERIFGFELTIMENPTRVVTATRMADSGQSIKIHADIRLTDEQQGRLASASREAELIEKLVESCRQFGVQWRGIQAPLKHVHLEDQFPIERATPEDFMQTLENVHRVDSQARDLISKALQISRR